LSHERCCPTPRSSGEPQARLPEPLVRRHKVDCCAERPRLIGTGNRSLQAKPSSAFLSSGLGVLQISPEAEHVSNVRPSSPQDSRCAQERLRSYDISRIPNTRNTMLKNPIVLQHSRVPGANRFHALAGETLEFLEFAIVDLEPSNTLKNAHSSLPLEWCRNAPTRLFIGVALAASLTNRWL
jgi:hypothetical protein